MCAHTSGVCCHLGGEWGSNGRRLPICALTSGVSCQGQRLGREPTGMRPGRPTALAAGPDMCTHIGSLLPAGLPRSGPAGPGGREPPPFPGRRSPPRASGAARGAGGGMRAGPRGARRRLRPACAPAAWLPAWASRAGASAPLAGRGSSRADGKRIPRVRVGRVFRHPGAGGGGRLPESPPRVYARDEASDAGPSRGGVPLLRDVDAPTVHERRSVRGKWPAVRKWEMAALRARGADGGGVPHSILRLLISHPERSGLVV